ncbi:hypothetical protein GW17_00019538 [Ensete ventricosum]|nr:hypothetical protein GW17_00019538 [Ensete ventricosum]
MSCVMQDLPYDSTGELKRVRSFVEDNMDTCKWVAVGVIIIQVSSVFHFKWLTTFVGTQYGLNQGELACNTVDPATQCP